MSGPVPSTAPRPLPPAAVLPRGVARASRQVEKALGDVGLTMPQYRLLAYLSRGHAMASNLAESLNVSAPSVTGLVDALVARGLVEREPDPDDRRRVTHRLTEAGTELLAEADGAGAARMHTILDHLSPDDRDAAIRGLTLLTEAFERMRTEKQSRAAAETRPEREPAG